MGILNLKGLARSPSFLLRWGSCAGEGERGVGKLCRGGREGCGEVVQGRERGVWGRGLIQLIDGMINAATLGGNQSACSTAHCSVSISRMKV